MTLPSNDALADCLRDTRPCRGVRIVHRFKRLSVCLCSHVPLERVLLESDLEEDAEMSQALLDACRAITAAKAQEVEGLTLRQVADITAENVQRFLATIGRPPPAPKPKKKAEK